jgi:rubredoxin
MPIQIVCPHCGAKGNAPDSIAGQQVRCSKCKNAFTAQSPVPAAGNPAAAFGFEEPVAPLAVDETEPVSRPLAPSAPRAGGGFGSFLLFRSFGGRILIFVYFWVMLALVLFLAVSSIWASFALFQISAGAAIVQLLLGLVMLIVGPIMVRLSGEVMAVLFLIHERLGEMTELLRRERR